MNLHAQQFLKVLHESGMVKQAAPWFPVNEQIEIAILVGLTARYGTEHAKIAGTTLCGEAEDFLATI